MNSTRALLPGDVEHAGTGTGAGLAQPRGSFFLTLCPVAAPVTVPEPTLPGLRGFRFFFTRVREDRRERCWLHFGHFRTAGEAQKWLNALRKVYPRAVLRRVPETEDAAQGHSALQRREARRPAISEPKSLNDTHVRALLEKRPVEGERPGHQAWSRIPEPATDSTLEDTLNELRDSAQDTFEMDADSLGSTGVRHLRVEVQRTSREQKRRGTSPGRKR
jgi:hypothetical protein